ncbi:DUF4197 domain-containing protein [Methylomagnum ishizawai]|uniref:DUF4197 domain-containing protein n=1 Tax=Methylomagnum ishizawai TaxID=1760988 RepID=UPI001C3403FE|nr:DUF4197 domain-containing protein [Methylomagnum ishizawai]BBL75467.1 hypothetical protein MishRS11D_25650 [Methylomagnum ishizawai]
MRTPNENETLRKAGISQEQWEALKLIVEAVKGMSVTEAQGILGYAGRMLPWFSVTPKALDEQALLGLIQDGVEF